VSLGKPIQELDHGPLHSIPIWNELINEENYFFRFSKYQEPPLVLPQGRSTGFCGTRFPPQRDLNLRSWWFRRLSGISPSKKKKCRGGIGVPGDEAHVMYVWLGCEVDQFGILGLTGWAKPISQWCGQMVSAVCWER